MIIFNNTITKQTKEGMTMMILTAQHKCTASYIVHV